MFNQKEYQHQWYLENREKCIERARLRYKEKIKEIKEYEYKRARKPERKLLHKKYNETYKKKNVEKIKETNKLYKEKCKKLGIGEFSILGKKRRNEYALENYYKRYKKDINYTLSVSLRNRTYIAIKNNQKVGSAVKDLGCSVNELKIYLKDKFIEGMTWNNWGKWHIDHIKPLSKFDLSDRKQYLEAVNYSNLQPLWATDNLKKGNRFNADPFLNEEITAEDINI